MPHHDIIINFRSVAVGEQLIPLELASGTDEDQLQPTKSSMDTIGMALDQVHFTRLHIILLIDNTASH